MVTHLNTEVELTSTPFPPLVQYSRPSFFHQDHYSQKMFIQWYRRYSRVSIDSLDDNQSESIVSLQEKRVQRTPKYRTVTLSPSNVAFLIVSICGIVILATLSIYGFFYMAKNETRSHETQNHDNVRLCGNSSAEALSLRCSFDQLTWSWYPPQCPHYANDDFLGAEQWQYYNDLRSKEPLVGENWTKALDNQLPLWGERREHLTHCVYLFLSVGQVLRDGTRYSTKLGEYEHLNHCSKVVLESMRKDPDWHKIETFVGKVSYEQTC